VIATRCAPRQERSFSWGLPAFDTTRAPLLAAISASVLVLVLRGSDTKPYATAAARHVADHVPNARIHQIPGAGHAVPPTHPEPLAQALVKFFSPAQQPA